MKKGSHVKFVGNLYSTTKRAKGFGYSNIQTFIGSNRSYTRTKISNIDIENTHKYCTDNDIHIYTHIPYCCNLANPQYYDRGISTIKQEIYNFNDCDLEISGVLHPGSNGKLNNIVKLLDTIDITRRTKYHYNPYRLLLENAASINKFGGKLSDLSYIINKTKPKNNGIGVCIDTAHIHGAGLYRLNKVEQVQKLFTEIDRVIGIEYLQLIHLNDSGVEFGTQKDLHSCLCQGYIWKERVDGLYEILKYCDRKKIDWVMETPRPWFDLFILSSI